MGGHVPFLLVTVGPCVCASGLDICYLRYIIIPIIPQPITNTIIITTNMGPVIVDNILPIPDPIPCAAAPIPDSYVYAVFVVLSTLIPSLFNI